MAAIFKTALLTSAVVIVAGFAAQTPAQAFTHQNPHAGIAGPEQSIFVNIADPKKATGEDTQMLAGAENFVNTMARRALDFLANSGMSHDQKQAAFRKLLEDNYDMETIGRFTLGRYWKTATEEQRAEYQKLFKKRVVDMYSKRFSEYKGQKFETSGARVEGETDAIVTSKIVPLEGPQVMVEWRVRYKNGRYRVVDVIVEGVSMSVTQRSDFSSVIQQGGGDVQVLLDHLRQPV